MRYLGDFDLGEEAAAEAFAVAAQRWPREGTPASPRAWLLTVGRRVAIDRIRRDRAFASNLRLLVPPDVPEPELEEKNIPDERLELIFGCCHPALPIEAQVALTLRALGGLSTEKVARAFLVTAETMKRRLSRAKAKIKEAGIPFEMPPVHHLRERLAAILAIVYLIFNQGYGGTSSLADEAIRLGRVLALLLPDQPEVHGLLALMLIQDSRRDARMSGNDLVLLADQDRDLWRTDMIDEGRAELERAIALNRHGVYTLQAAIASLQCERNIDWPRVVQLYEELSRKTQSPVVELNRAVAVAEAGSPEAALQITDVLDLDQYLYFHSTQAELLRRMGRTAEAKTAYERALHLASSEPEARFLRRRLSELADSDDHR